MIPLRYQIQGHVPLDEHEAAMTRRLSTFLDFLEEHHQTPFERDLAGRAPEHGHVTGSAWIVNRDRTKVVLLHHGKLGKWVQPGGHCDGQNDVLAVAAREAEEETGLSVLPIGNEIFDIDVHEIPEYWNTPAHLHFDVRYLLEADDTAEVVLSHESREVRWVSLDEALALSGEESIARMVAKTRRLQKL